MKRKRDNCIFEEKNKKIKINNFSSIENENLNYKDLLQIDILMNIFSFCTNIKVYFKILQCNHFFKNLMEKTMEELIFNKTIEFNRKIFDLDINEIKQYSQNIKKIDNVEELNKKFNEIKNNGDVYIASNLISYLYHIIYSAENKKIIPYKIECSFMFDLIFKSVDTDINVAIEKSKYFIKNIDPYSTFVRFELLECYKLNRNMDEFLKLNYETLDYCFLPKDIAKVYRNFGFYYLEKTSPILSVFFLIRSLEFELNLNVLIELDTIANNLLVIYIDFIVTHDLNVDNTTVFMLYKLTNIILLTIDMLKKKFENMDVPNYSKMNNNEIFLHKLYENTFQKKLILESFLDKKTCKLIRETTHSNILLLQTIKKNVKMDYLIKILKKFNTKFKKENEKAIEMLKFLTKRYKKETNHKLKEEFNKKSKSLNVILYDINDIINEKKLKEIEKCFKIY